MQRTIKRSILCLWLVIFSVTLFAQPTPTNNFDIAVRGYGNLLLNARMVKFQLSAFKAGPNVSGYMELIEMSPSANRSVRLTMDRVRSLVMQNSNTAEITGSGYLNRQPAIIKVKATDFGGVLTVLDKLEVSASTANSTIAYSVGGSVYPGDIKIVFAPTLVHQVLGRGALNLSNTRTAKFEMDIREVIPSNVRLSRFQGYFTYVDQDLLSGRSPIEIKSLTITSLIVDGSTASIAGTASFNGESASFAIKVFDGRLSPLLDTFSIAISQGSALVYSASGNVRDGDIDIR